MEFICWKYNLVVTNVWPLILYVVHGNIVLDERFHV